MCPEVEASVTRAACACWGSPVDTEVPHTDACQEGTRLPRGKSGQQAASCHQLPQDPVHLQSPARWRHKGLAWWPGNAVWCLVPSSLSALWGYVSVRLCILPSSHRFISREYFHLDSASICSSEASLRPAGGWAVSLSSDMLALRHFPDVLTYNIAF